MSRQTIKNSSVLRELQLHQRKQGLSQSVSGVDCPCFRGRTKNCSRKTELTQTIKVCEECGGQTTNGDSSKTGTVPERQRVGLSLLSRVSSAGTRRSIVRSTTNPYLARRDACFVTSPARWNTLREDIR